VPSASPASRNFSCLVWALNAEAQQSRNNINWSSKVRMPKQKLIFVEKEAAYLHMNV